MNVDERSGKVEKMEEKVEKLYVEEIVTWMENVEMKRIRCGKLLYIFYDSFSYVKRMCDITILSLLSS